MERKPQQKLKPSWSFLKPIIVKKKQKQVENKPYACQFCTERFLTPSAVSLHASKTHPAVFERGTVYAPSARKDRYHVHGIRSNHKCTRFYDCDVSFETLQKHRQRIKAKEKYEAREKMGYFVQRKNAQKQHCIRVPKDEWQTRIRKWDKAKTREAKEEFLEDYPDMRTAKNACKRTPGWRKILNERISILRSNTRNFSMTLGYIHLLTPKNLNDAFFCDHR